MNTKFFAILILISSLCFGQMQDFKYKRELKGIANQWHTITIPNEMYGKISQDLSDIRIFGLKANKDTIEAAYILRKNDRTIIKNEIPFKIINQSFNNEGAFYTFEIPSIQTINDINLQFSNDNFDWKLNLEGSNDQTDWFKILANSRILSIKNGSTNFQFTKLLFPESKYKYYRIFIKTKEKVGLKSAKLVLNESNLGLYRDFKIQKQSIFENKKAKQTEINLELDVPVPVSLIKISANNNFDFYRPISIQYLSDSVKTEKAWIYNYETIGNGTLNSLDKNEFTLNTTTAKKLKIIIENNNNPILNISDIKVQGFTNQLDVRFVEDADYFLVYGNKNAEIPNFDIVNFADKIPENISTLTLGNEILIDKSATEITEPLFKNKLWLWIIMGVIIAMLGFFSLKMMKKED
ncbi:DUF3999 family protein [Frigoriflavimonas asaccharolytica]|uniref:DUF3999 family protein n=1 Tax=Frigoriflavimonas asaccharolytica TaxID=2735899 RepID=A0A8J8G4V2_9FLAO|nr:DUF3999 family protein [Frigoriflavimonas asaccharolytica]NRS91299.1 hypothetical protein [Frigoriflavimonas asaccharolytica]